MNDEWPSSSHDFCALSESAHIRLLLGAVALGECWYAAGSGSLWPEREREREHDGKRDKRVNDVKVLMTAAKYSWERKHRCIL